jgi:hypothetical protein
VRVVRRLNDGADLFLAIGLFGDVDSVKLVDRGLRRVCTLNDVDLCIHYRGEGTSNECNKRPQAVAYSLHNVDMVLNPTLTSSRC